MIDFPPGTGDIQITLCQELKIDGAVIVTTPQRLSVVDVIKGIEMFDDLKVPTIATIENMSSFECPSCHTSHKIFGHGYLNLLRDQFGINNSFDIPLDPEISRYSDIGTPVALTLPENHKISKIYNAVATGIHSEIQKLQKGDQGIIE